jgi:hypothetical protein
MKNMIDYSTRVQVLMAELRSKTLAQAKQDRHITQLEYAGTGYGYNLKALYPKNMKQARKDVETPELKKLEKIIASLG